MGTTLCFMKIRAPGDLCGKLMIVSGRKNPVWRLHSAKLYLTCNDGKTSCGSLSELCGTRSTMQTVLDHLLVSEVGHLIACPQTARISKKTT